MQSEEKETVICPYAGCGEVLEVDGNFGFGRMCPECGQRIDVFSDETIVVQTKSGKIAIQLSLDGNGNGNGTKASFLKTALDLFA